MAVKARVALKLPAQIIGAGLANVTLNNGIYTISVGAAPTGNYGDITVSADGETWTINPEVISTYGRTLTSAAHDTAARGVLGVGSIGTLNELNVNDLADTTITSPVDADVLTYDSTTGKWVNEPASGVGGNNPGGVGTEVQYRFDGSTFGAMGGTTWDETNRSLTIAGATITADNPILELSQTWNNAAVTFTSFKLDVTDTSSGAASRVIDLQVGGSSVFNVTKGGKVTFYGAFVGNNNYYGITSTGAGTVSFATADFMAYAECEGSQFSAIGGTTTVNKPVFNGAQSWNDAGVTFKGISLVITDTASAAASKLIDLLVGAASKFNVDKTGIMAQAVLTVATLPAAGTAGRRSFVTDANATTFASIVAGGGANGVPVYDDGTNWRIG